MHTLTVATDPRHTHLASADCTERAAIVVTHAYTRHLCMNITHVLSTYHSSPMQQAVPKGTYVTNTQHISAPASAAPLPHPGPAVQRDQTRALIPHCCDCKDNKIMTQQGGADRLLARKPQQRQLCQHKLQCMQPARVCLQSKNPTCMHFSGCIASNSFL